MGQHSHGRKGSQFLDGEFAEALYEDKSSRSSSDRQAERKTQQFCRQVQRALNLALTGCNVGDGLGDIFVEEVIAAPDCGHLLVHVVIPEGLPVVDAMTALGRMAPGLRSEVASAISRKRAPELCFVPANEDGCRDA